MNRVIRKTTGIKRPRIVARKAPKETSRPMVPPSTATTAARVLDACSTTLVSRDILGMLLILESANLLVAGQ